MMSYVHSSKNTRFADSGYSTVAVGSLEPLGLQGSLAQTLPSGTHPFFDDYESYELSLFDELNLMRKNPPAYAEKLQKKILLFAPDVRNEPLNSESASLLLNSQRELFSKVQLEFAAVDEEMNKEVTKLKELWVTDDIERSKKVRKGVSGGGKRGISTVIDGINVEAEQSAALERVAATFRARKETLEAQLQALSESIVELQRGLAAISRCVARLRSAPAVEPLTYFRGLALAARDVSYANVKVESVLRKYGRLTGNSSTFTLSGQHSPEQALFQIIALQSNSHEVRSNLLRCTFVAAGCGWLCDMECLSKVTIIVAEHYEELVAVKKRAQLPLQEVRRQLPLALRYCSNSMISFRKDMGVTLVSPKVHPIECNGLTRIEMEAEDGVAIVGNVSPDEQPEVVTPSATDTSVFVHRNGESGNSEIFVLTPSVGKFRLTLFVRKRPSGCPFVKLGCVMLHSTGCTTFREFSSLPLVSIDFLDRQCTLVTPLNGNLSPLSLQTFRIRIPISVYRYDELRSTRIEIAEAERQQGIASMALAEAKRQVELLRLCSDDRSSELTNQLGEMNAALQELREGSVKRRGKDIFRSRGGEEELINSIEELKEGLRLLHAQRCDGERNLQSLQCRCKQRDTHVRRLKRDEQRIVELTDRTKPVDAALVMRGCTHQALHAEDDYFTVYSTTIRVPKDGQIMLFIGCVKQVVWNVRCTA